MLIGFSLLQQSRLKISEEENLFPQHAQKIEKKISNYILTFTDTVSNLVSMQTAMNIVCILLILPHAI